MVANAKAAGDEVASLKMRIMEMEMGFIIPSSGRTVNPLDDLP